MPRVVLLGRLSLYGRKAERLHEEVVPVAARWIEPSQRKGPLVAFAKGAEAKPKTCPALIVCPTSLVFNWVAEAKKFTPGLKVLALENLWAGSIIFVTEALTSFASLIFGIRRSRLKLSAKRSGPF